MSDRSPQATAQPRKKRGAIIIGIVIAAVIILILLRLFGGKSGKHATPPQVVSVAAAALGNMPEILNELGTVTPTDTVTVLPQLSGYLTEVAYKEGQDVSKGQFLAQIDPRQYQIDKQQAQAQLAKDQASLDQARTDLARYTTLHAQRSIAEQTYVDQKFTVQQDEASVKADQAAIAQYDLDLAYCHITAPVAGRVGLRLVDPGNYVTASSSPGIVTITTMKPTTVVFNVPQNSLGQVLQRFQSGAKLAVIAFNSDNTAQLASGTLYAIGNQMATSTGTVSLRATFANNSEALFPNEFVNVQLLVDTLHDAVLVPTPAVQSGAPGDYVYLVSADGKTVSVHKVTLGPSDGKDTVILTGLSVGQTVVTDGMDRLSDGAKIRVAGATRPTTFGTTPKGAKQKRAAASNTDAS
ncbi:MAG: efflux RND transporter periplasmic adaptor subunit [Rhodanobacteraceae bacterium]